MRYLSERLPAERRAPATILAALRRVDPAADVIYLGEGEWWVGVMRPNQHRARIGAAIARREWAKPHPAWGQIRYAECAQHGFAYLCTHYGDLDGSVVARVREMDWNWRHRQPEFEDYFLNSPEVELNHTHRSYLKSRAAADVRSHLDRIKGRRAQYHASLN